MATSIIPDPSPRWRRLRRWLIRLGVLVILWLTVSLIVAHQLTRRKRARFDEPVPSVLWAKFEEVRLPTSDGQDLGAWYSDGQAQGPSIILLHGNGGHRAHNLSRAEILASTGHSVLLVSLRAHGDSSGDYNDIGYSSRSDVIAAVEFLERKRPGRSIVILGSSLGAAAATFASEALGHRVAGYVLEAPYLDLKTAVRNRTRENLPIGLEWLAYQGLILVSPLVVPDLERTSPLKAIEGVPADVPVLLMVGRLDTKTTPEQVGQIFGRVRSHGRLVVFEEAEHLGYLQADLELYRRSLLDFLKPLRSD